MTEHKGLCDALLAFQAEAPTLKKSAVNPHFKSKYVSLDSLIETVNPILTKHGLIWTTLPGTDDQGRPTLRYRLIHAATAESLEGVMPLLLGKEDSQGLGSALTYSRRYALSAVLDLASEDDDDGNRASGRQKASGTANGSAPECVTAEDVKSLAATAKGLSVEQIKLAMSACGIPIPDPFVWNKIPRDKGPALFKALAQAKRPEVAA